MATEFQSLILRQPPNMPDADVEQLQRSQVRSLRAQLILYENLVERYGPHPFFLVKMAALYALSDSPSMALRCYQEAQSRMLDAGTVDPVLDVVIADVSEVANQAAKEFLDKDRELTSKGFYSAQPWKPTKAHKFPVSLPMTPKGHEAVRQEWKELTPDVQLLYSKYLTKLAIETNQIESTFFLTEGSIQDLVRRGISSKALHFLPNSPLKDPAQTESILNDTLAAYDLLKPLVWAEKPMLDRGSICRIHACLMKTDRFNSDSTGCVVAGSTRSLTRKNVMIRGRQSMIQCCPFPEVDKELDYICKMVNQWISSWSRNPFATASWIHLVLVRCHPFEDGNGRLGRLLASIPLMRYGYLPIAIKGEQHAAYYDAINNAYNEDHRPFVDCMLKGTQDTLVEVKAL